jgi:hypothetical protein
MIVTVSFTSYIAFIDHEQRPEPVDDQSPESHAPYVVQQVFTQIDNLNESIYSHIKSLSNQEERELKEECGVSPLIVSSPIISISTLTLFWRFTHT